MDTTRHSQFDKDFQGSDAIISYSGMISQELLVELGETLKNYLTAAGLTDHQIRLVFSIFIELTQNIVRYSAEKISIGEKNYGKGSISFQDEEHFYILRSGNLVEKDKVKIITDICQHINSLDESGMKKYYQEQRKKPKDEFAKGAQLGFIDIARKVKDKLNIIFYDINSTYSFFVFTVPIKKETL